MSPSTPRPNRRLLLGAFGATLAAPAIVRAQGFAAGTFTHGVASGDPDASSVVLWTRFVPKDAGPGLIGWEAAEDARFAAIAARGTVLVEPGDDYCAKVIAQGLQPGRPYAYRFLAANGESPTGETRTAPQGGVNALTLAVFSCANLPFGRFHAYGHAAARDDIDLCIHTGDYIYEYGRGRYPSDSEAMPGRLTEPAGEILALSDYHARYASYRADPDLQELHRRTPMLAVWDDHEFANDAWSGGAEGHQFETEGAWVDRVAAAVKAYRDWMPIRPSADADRSRIWRSLEWGDLASLLLLDTRFHGRDRQPDAPAALLQHVEASESAFAAALSAYRPILQDAHRSLLGPAQEKWLAEELTRSRGRGAVWQVLAQQIVMGERLFGEGMSALLGAGASPGRRRVQALSARMARYGLSSWGDAWGGYPAARARLLGACQAAGANAVVLSGDTHNAWACTLPGPDGRGAAAVEAACSSVTSPGLERSFDAGAPGAREAAMLAQNPELNWCDLTRRGYTTLHLTPTTATAEWLAFADIRADVATPVLAKRLVAEPSAGAGPGAWTPA